MSPVYGGGGGAEPRYEINLNKQAFVHYTPTGDNFIAPGNLTVTVKNSGNQPTGELQINLILEDEENDIGLCTLDFDELYTGSIDNIAPGAEAQFTVVFDSIDPGPYFSAAKIKVGNTKTKYSYLDITYGVYDFIPLDDLLFTVGETTLARLEMGAATGIVAKSASFDVSSGLEWFSSDPAVAVIDKETGALTLVSPGVAVIGYIDRETMTVTGKKVVIYPADYQPPRVTAITLDGNAPRNLVLTYTQEMSAASGIVGFTLSGSTTGIGITGTSVDAAVNEKQLILTLNKVPAQSEVNNLTLAYTYPADGIGGVVDKYESPVTDPLNEDSVSVAITVTALEKFAKPPAVQSAGIEGETTGKDKVVVTFDQPVAATSSAGFAITGSTLATSFAGAAVDENDAKRLILTLNRKPSYTEIAGLGLTYNAAAGNVKHGGNDHASLAAPGFTGAEALTITVTGFTSEADGPLALVSVTIDADNDGDGTATIDEAKKVFVKYNKAVTATNANGFTISGSLTATTITGIAVSATDTTVLIFTLNDWPSASESGQVKLSYDWSLGNVQDTEGTPAESFTDTVIVFQNYTGLGNNQDLVKPKMVSALVEDGSRSTVRVVFSEPVLIPDAGKFKVNVNDLPWKSGTTMDAQLRETENKTITAVLPIDGNTTNGASTWDMTMSSPARHGDILRLATTEAGAAKDPSNNELPEIPEFIVRSLVKRTKGAYESRPGFYINDTLYIGVTGVDYTGTNVNSGATYVNGDVLFENAITYLASAPTSVWPKNGWLYTIVLGENQEWTSAPSGSFFSTGNGAGQIPSNFHTNGNSCRLIFTTVTGNTQDFTIACKNGAAIIGRNGLVLILDEHVILENQSIDGTNPNDTHGAGLLQGEDGTTIILDGGEIKNNIAKGASGIRGAAFRIGGGSYGSYVLMNSGKITGNRIIGTTASGSAGAIFINSRGVFVMHGGEITNNEVYRDGNAATTSNESIYAGAIASQSSATVSVFMTGGIIAGNKVTITGTKNNIGAGAIAIKGVFQKNGGVIYGADAGDAALRNTTNTTGNVAVGAVAIMRSSGNNPAKTATIIRNNSAGPDVTLFTVGTGTPTIPDWAESNWDADGYQPAP